MDLTHPLNWPSLIAGSTVSLSDEQSLLQSKKNGNGLKPLDMTVERVSVITELDRRMSWVLINLSGGEIPLLLMGKVVDNLVDYRIYFPIPEINPASRKQNIDAGNFWMFKDPNKPDFKLGELEFNGDVYYDANGTKLIYNIKPQGSLNGTVVEHPKRTGITDLLATVVEYNTTQPTESPEILVLELGSRYNADGGLITYYFGSSLNSNEIQFLNLAK